MLVVCLRWFTFELTSDQDRVTGQFVGPGLGVGLRLVACLAHQQHGVKRLVAVPLGPRTVNGVVWDREPDDVPADKLKSVLERLPAPPLPDVSRRFVEWVAGYNMSSWGPVLKMAMSVPAALLGAPANRKRPLSNGGSSQLKFPR